MSRKLGYGVQPQFEILVANLTGRVDKLGNPIKQRTGFRIATAFDARGRGSNASLGGTPGPSTAEVVVADNTFTDTAFLQVGPFLLRNGTEWTPGGSPAASATALAAAINNLSGYSALAVGATVEITGPGSIAGLGVVFRAYYDGAVENFTLTPETGTFEPGGPAIDGSQSIIP